MSKKHSKLSKAIGKIGEKQREKASEAAKKAGKEIKKVAEKAKHPFDVMADLALAPGKVAVFATLAPVAGAMKLALSKRKVSVPGSKLDYPENLARQFYQVVILKNPPLTKGIGLASKSHLEHADANQVIDTAASLASNVPGLPPVAAATAAQIIKAVLNFFKGNKKLSDVQKAVAAKLKQNPSLTPAQATAQVPPPALTPAEKAAVTNAPAADHEIAAATDHSQDVLVANGIGNVDSKGNVVAEEMATTGFRGWLNRVLHTKIKPKHHLEGEEGEEAPQKKLISKPINENKKAPEKEAKSPMRGLTGRLFSSVRHYDHLEHLESLEHAEGRCNCKHKGK
jgi:hypothetical protein